MGWWDLVVTAPAGRAGALAARLEALGAAAVSLADAADDPVYEPPPGAAPLWRATAVHALAASREEAVRLADALAPELTAEEAAGLRIEALPERDWVRAWMEDFRPMRFGRRLWVCPSTEPPPPPPAVAVVLDPGLAFGTGTHPSTALCLEWLDAAELAGRRVVDYGCGSGILAVAAARLGAAEVLAVDIDPQALAATRANAERNGVAGRIRTLPADAPLPAGAADVVLANILANTLVALAPRLTALLAPDGVLVLAGVLEGQAGEVAAAYPALRFRRAVREGWARLDGMR
ncbi:50S ribosomal protein L11 methyltransferase [Inmirania thermothiophila]|uniref:Ribosomal protein L11 methyltransferase n=1 Tax=Inmirania thermothiophila TaxID=1750597 RepID=A0A3N1XSF5_9GAMM|nr:50S ribosomal protein L11 methyltransferase [Inmirania thermothiophila]ROR29593.1 [LSU ribosomal protein L11P]-lysine N-methyltransferase [Inmirania thermothiophila]